MGRDQGLEVVDSVARSLNIEEEWKVEEARGFTWWAHSLAQRVWADVPVSRGGRETVRVHACTDLWREVPEDAETLEGLNALNMSAGLSAYVWDGEAARVRLYCSVSIDNENRARVMRLFGAAVRLQAAEAHARTARLAEGLGTSADTTDHPERGGRLVPHPVIGFLESLAVPPGTEGAAVSAAEFREAGSNPSSAGCRASTAGSGLIVEYPFTGVRSAVELLAEGLERAETSIFSASNEVHPLLGRGLRILLKLPLSLDAGRGMALAAALNIAPAEAEVEGQMLGGWCFSDDLTFAGFVPARLYEPGLLVDLGAGCQTLSRWVAARLIG